MPKLKTTRKSITESYRNIVSIDYRDARHLLHNHSPIAYTWGTHGWNFDVYDINGTAICTGCRGMPGVHLPNVREYDRKAEEILYNNSKKPYEEREALVEKLLLEFLAQKEAERNGNSR